LKDFITASELKILGLQRQGFYAFADGVYNDNSFHKVNKYGVVNVEGLEHVESEYRSDIKHFYPHPTQRFTKQPMKAMIHSKMIDTLFTKYSITRSMGITDGYCFGDKGKFGVAFCLAANFRDLFIKHYNFPLFGVWPKRQRKVGFLAFRHSFYHNLNPLS
jgi:hypothetical protein